MHIVVKRFYLHAPDGQRLAKLPGEEIPEAKDWRNYRVMVRRGYITDEKGNYRDRKGRMVPYIKPEDKPIEISPFARTKPPKPEEPKAEEPKVEESRVEEPNTEEPTKKKRGRPRKEKTEE